MELALAKAQQWITSPQRLFTWTQIRIVDPTRVTYGGELAQNPIYDLPKGMSLTDQKDTSIHELRAQRFQLYGDYYALQWMDFANHLPTATSERAALLRTPLFDETALPSSWLSPPSGTQGVPA